MERGGQGGGQGLGLQPHHLSPKKEAGGSEQRATKAPLSSQLFSRSSQSGWEPDTLLTWIDVIGRSQGIALAFLQVPH